LKNTVWLKNASKKKLQLKGVTNMTRLFTKILCKICNGHHKDIPYITGKKTIVGGVCFKCTIKEWKKEESE
ncbi:MAG TPA: hypothetical protein VK085_11505, partial [Pseudogracilibacillus sp.]|nr:hypothetical protein [Pseudogracilibacillus sp.]